jgi:hypothetical protein
MRTALEINRHPSRVTFKTEGRVSLGENMGRALFEIGQVPFRQEISYA